MGDFDNRSLVPYNAESPDRIKFGNNRVLIHTELNEMQDNIYTNVSHMIQHMLTNSEYHKNMVILLGDIEYTSTTIKIPNCIISYRIKGTNTMFTKFIRGVEVTLNCSKLSNSSSGKYTVGIAMDFAEYKKGDKFDRGVDDDGVWVDDPEGYFTFVHNNYEYGPEDDWYVDSSIAEETSRREYLRCWIGVNRYYNSNINNYSNVSICTMDYDMSKNIKSVTENGIDDGVYKILSGGIIGTVNQLKETVPENIGTEIDEIKSTIAQANSKLQQLEQSIGNGGSSSGSVGDRPFIESCPIGTIIPHMGIEAPNGYLACDGSEYNIADYEELALHFETNFGSSNYFGGDGETTFAVPDLSGEFLRSTGGNGADVGTHQDPTNVPYIFDNSTSEVIFMKSDQGNGNYISNRDSYKLINDIVKLYQVNPDVVYDNNTDIISCTIRPTNTSVLYCIKAYEVAAIEVYNNYMRPMMPDYANGTYTVNPTGNTFMVPSNGYISVYNRHVQGQYLEIQINVNNLPVASYRDYSLNHDRGDRSPLFAVNSGDIVTFSMEGCIVYEYGVVFYPYADTDPMVTLTDKLSNRFKIVEIHSSAFTMTTGQSVTGTISLDSIPDGYKFMDVINSWSNKGTNSVVCANYDSINNVVNYRIINMTNGTCSDHVVINVLCIKDADIDSNVMMNISRLSNNIATLFENADRTIYDASQTISKSINAATWTEIVRYTLEYGTYVVIGEANVSNSSATSKYIAIMDDSMNAINGVQTNTTVLQNQVISFINVSEDTKDILLGAYSKDAATVANGKLLIMRVGE